MSINTHVPSRTTQGLSLSIRNMLFRLGVPILFRHSKINDMDDVGRFSRGTTDEEIIRFDISVNQVLLMNRLNSGQLKSNPIGVSIFTPCEVERRGALRAVRRGAQ